MFISKILNYLNQIFNGFHFLPHNLLFNTEFTLVAQYSPKKRTPTRQFVELGDAHGSGESASDGEGNLRSQLLDRIKTASEIDRRINAIAAHLSTQFQLWI